MCIFYTHYINFDHFYKTLTMFDLKLFRIKNNLSQSELASILKCPQGYISRMENNKMVVSDEYIDLLKSEFGSQVDEFIIGAKPSKLLTAFGYRTKGEKGYQHLRDQLVVLLEAITKTTGYTIEEISQKIYRKKTLIPSALQKEIISPNMVNYIHKHLGKVGLDPATIELEKQSSVITTETPYFTSIDAMINNLKPDSYFSLPIFPDIDAFVKINTIQNAPSVTINNIVGVKEVSLKEIKAGSYYILVFAKNKYSLDFIRVNNKENYWHLCNNNIAPPYAEIAEKSIIKAYQIQTLISKQ